MGFIEETKKPEPQIQPFSFDFSEEQGSGKEVYAIYGDKGDGKTTLSLSFPGTITVLSFDNKATIVKNNFYNGDNRIKIFNALRYLEKTPEKYFDTSEITYNYIIALLEKLKEQSDWILFDCAEEMTVICEMIMRKRNNIKLFGGIVNQNVWKERNMLIDSIHKKALNCCTKGLIYTLYIKKDEIIEEGQVVTKKDVPKWTGIILLESDFVIRAELQYDKEIGKQCFARIWSSKNDKKLKTGSIINVTDFKNKLFKNIDGEKNGN